MVTTTLDLTATIAIVRIYSAKSTQAESGKHDGDETVYLGATGY